MKIRVASAIATARSAAVRSCAAPGAGRNETMPVPPPIWARRSRAAGGRAARRRGPDGDPRDVVAGGEERGHGRRVRHVPLDAEVERPEPAQHQEAIERAGHAAHRVLEEPEPLGDRRVAGDRDPEDRVAVAREVLRRRVEDDVRAEVQRTLERRRRERVVDHEERPAGRVPRSDP